MADNRAVMVALAVTCAAGASSPGAVPPSAAVRDVRMLETERGAYVFEPAELTIRAGDRVRWINVSGGPHNVAFYPDRVPPGARERLNRAMPGRLGSQALVGRLLVDEGEAYEISFAGLPPGAYDYMCTPHEMAGMQARIVVVR